MQGPEHPFSNNARQHAHSRAHAGKHRQISRQQLRSLQNGAGCKNLPDIMGDGAGDGCPRYSPYLSFSYRDPGCKACSAGDPDQNHSPHTLAAGMGILDKKRNVRRCGKQSGPQGSFFRMLPDQQHNREAQGSS